MVIRNLVLLTQMIGVVIMVWNEVFVIRQKPSPMQGHLTALLFSTIIMYIGYYAEIKAQCMETALLAAAFSYIGKPFIMLSSFMVICTFYNIKINKWLYNILFIICASFFIFVYTTPSTHLYYSTMAWDESLTYSKLVLSHGPLYTLYIAMAILYFISCIIVIARGYRNDKTAESGYYAFFLALMVICGIAGYLIYLLDASNGYDTTIVGIFGGVICLSILFFKYRIFDTLAIAKDEALYTSMTGLIILDKKDSVIYTNKIASELLDNKFNKERLLRLENEKTEVNVDDSFYNIIRREIVVNGVKSGTSFEIVDITNTHNYQQTLQQEVKERTEKIENIQRKIVGSFASIVEARSLETGQHIVRTSEYVRDIANALKDLGMYHNILTREYIELLAQCAPLHDVGKISVPDSIVNKPGKLSAEEFEKMKMHAEAGAKIIEQTMRGVESDEYVQLAHDVALYHHERWDGTGYPTGLKGKEIPLCARIMAIADCYDALLNERCYKPPFEKEKALKIINDESGSHFDPDIVKAFMIIINK